MSSKWSIRTNLVYRVSLTQGFGKTELENEGAGKLLEANVTIISNADCYEKLNNIITTNINGYNSRTQIKQAIYDGITDQLLCTEGLVVKREVCRGKRCRTREFITVSFFLQFYISIVSIPPNLYFNYQWFSFLVQLCTVFSVSFTKTKQLAAFSAILNKIGRSRIQDWLLKCDEQDIYWHKFTL